MGLVSGRPSGRRACRRAAGGRSAGPSAMVGWEQSARMANRVVRMVLACPFMGCSHTEVCSMTRCLTCPMSACGRDSDWRLMVGASQRRPQTRRRKPVVQPLAAARTGRALRPTGHGRLPPEGSLRWTSAATHMADLGPRMARHSPRRHRSAGSARSMSTARSMKARTFCVARRPSWCTTCTGSGAGSKSSSSTCSAPPRTCDATW